MQITEKSITFANVVELSKQVSDSIKSGDITFDFTNVEKVDSSAIALALDIVRQAETMDSKQKVRFLNTPESFKNLTHLYHLENIFPS